MEICTRVPDKSLYPLPAKMIYPESFDVFNLQGAKDVKYYTDGYRHGFLTKDRILTHAKYSAQHRAFNVGGIDKYAVGYLADQDYHPNKLEFISLKTQEKVFDHFGAYIPGNRFLSFRVDSEDGDISKNRWGIFDMFTDEMFIPASIPSDRISEIHKALEHAANLIAEYVVAANQEIQ